MGLPTFGGLRKVERSSLARSVSTARQAETLGLGRWFLGRVSAKHGRFLSAPVHWAFRDVRPRLAFGIAPRALGRDPDITGMRAHIVKVDSARAAAERNRVNGNASLLIGRCPVI